MVKESVKLWWQKLLSFLKLQLNRLNLRKLTGAWWMLTLSTRAFLLYSLQIPAVFSLRQLELLKLNIASKINSGLLQKPYFLKKEAVLWRGIYHWIFPIKLICMVPDHISQVCWVLSKHSSWPCMSSVRQPTGITSKGYKVLKSTSFCPPYNSGHLPEACSNPAYFSTANEKEEGIILRLN